jgi:Periplasmic component of the Tol biopolymer transport system
VTPNGEFVVFEETDPKTKFDIRLVTLKGAHTSTPLIQTPFNDQNPALSSDGAWLAYQSDESGRAEVYVCPFPKVDSGRWQVSTAGGTRPLWSRDGRDLFYLDVDRRLTVVSVQTQPTFHVSPPGAPRASVAESPYTDLPIPDSTRWPRINELFTRPRPNRMPWRETLDCRKAAPAGRRSGDSAPSD